MLRKIFVLLAVAGLASAEDSPMVALAKRTNRKAATKAVITNATIAASKGRLSGDTGSTTAPSVQPAAASAPSAAARPVPPAQPPVATSPTAYVTPQPVAATPAAAAAGAGYPSSSARNIDPSSSARTIDPLSTARTIDPTAGARTIDPQNTSRTIQPTSSAQNIPPQTSTSPQ